MRFAILGGDVRFVRLAQRLRQRCEVRCFALERALPDCAADAAEAVDGADAVVLPLPCEKSGALNAPLSDFSVPAAEALAHVAPGTPVLAGMPGAVLAEYCAMQSIPLTDYAAREEFALRNAELTAEGTLPLLLGLPKALPDCEILVCGYGRIGRRLAAKLNALGAKAAVAARSPAARAAAETEGCRTMAPGDTAGAWDAVVNTVPVPIWGAEALAGFGDALLVELASPPYGFDPAAARALGRRIVPASGLPGKTSPESAAAVLEKTILAILEERQATI